MTILRANLLDATGTLQLCSGQKAGYKQPYVHTLRHSYESEYRENIPLVDATDASYQTTMRNNRVHYLQTCD